ncbi:MAG: peptidoglycan bridge formation glycyltransferase FemA/FemB family protein [Nitrospirota bacterium]
MLLVSYHFPPSSEVGGLRTVHLATHLPEHGWQVEVLTIATRHVENQDPERLRGLDNIPVHRASKWPTLLDLYASVKRALTSRLDISRHGRARPSASATRTPKESIGARLRRYILSLLSLPDGYRSWVIPATLTALKLCRMRRYDCVMTTSPPNSSHLIGLLLTLCTGIKWIADFRDPWMTGGSKSLFETSALSLALERRLERLVLRHAHLVTANTAPLAELLHGAQPPDRRHDNLYIPNAIDWTRYTSYRQRAKREMFTLTYAGSLYYGRSPQPIFQAVRELAAEGKVSLDRLRIMLVGDCADIGGQPISDVTTGYGLAAVVEAVPTVPYTAALEFIARSHVALLFAPNQPYQLPAKIYDYMGLGVPILAIAGPGVTEQVLRETNTGAAFEPSNISGIKSYIANAYADFSHRTNRSLGARGLDRFEAARIAQSLSERLNELYQPPRTGLELPSPKRPPRPPLVKPMIQLTVSNHPGPDWSAWLTRLNGNLYHSAAWAESCRTAHKHPIYFHWEDEQARCVGAAVGIASRSPRPVIGRFSRRLDFETYPAAGDRADLALQMMADLARHASLTGHRALSIHSYLATGPVAGLERLGLSLSPRIEFAVDLTRSPDALWQALSAHHRRKIKKAGRLGLTLVEADSMEALRQFRALQVASRERRRSRGEEIGMLDDLYYEEKGRRYFGRNLGRLCLMLHRGTPVSAAFIALYGGQALYVHGGSSDEGFRMNAPALLFWEAFLQYRTRGCDRFNLGGVPADAADPQSPSHGLYRFKAGFGGRELALADCTTEGSGLRTRWLLQSAKALLRSGGTSRRLEVPLT